MIFYNILSQFLNARITDLEQSYHFSWGIKGDDENGIITNIKYYCVICKPNIQTEPEFLRVEKSLKENLEDLNALVQNKTFKANLGQETPAVIVGKKSAHDVFVAKKNWNIFLEKMNSL